MPVQQANHALTAAQCLKIVEKRQKLLAGPTPAKPMLGRKSQLRGFRRIRMQSKYKLESIGCPLIGASAPRAALSTLGRPIVFAALHDFESLCAVRAPQTTRRLKLYRAISRILPIRFDHRLSHSIAAKILYTLMGNAFPTEG